MHMQIDFIMIYIYIPCDCTCIPLDRMHKLILKECVIPTAPGGKECCPTHGSQSQAWSKASDGA